MTNVILKFPFYVPLYTSTVEKQCPKFLNRYFSDDVKYTLKKEKILHPYRKLHPWKSRESFSRYLLNNVIYERGQKVVTIVFTQLTFPTRVSFFLVHYLSLFTDGLVAINKPYGISARKPIDINKNNSHPYSIVPNGVDYTLDDSMPFLAEKLGYAELFIVKTPEK